MSVDILLLNLANTTQLGDLRVFIIDGEHLLHLHTKQLQLPCLGKKKRYKSRSAEHYRALLSMLCGVHPCCSGFFPNVLQELDPIPLRSRLLVMYIWTGRVTVRPKAAVH